MAGLLSAALAPRRLFQYALAYSTLVRPPVHAGRATTNLIIDTDLFSDIDDAAALLLASTLPNTNLLAVTLNTPSSYSALAASAILNHYNHPTTPIGLSHPWTNDTFLDTWSWTLGEYASKLAYHWSGGSAPWHNLSRTQPPVSLYRRTLASAPDASITIASIGFLTSLSALLDSPPDAHSPLDGTALVTRKVAELVVMGGAYPRGHEYNFWGADPSATARVVNSWPDSVPATFLGSEVGELVSTGARLTVEGPAGDPVRRGYEWYVGYNRTRFSWDPLTVVYAVGGLGSWFEYAGEGGRNYVFANGSNVWVEGEGAGKQRYVRLRVGNETVARELEDLLLEGARRWEGEGEGLKMTADRELA